MKTNKKFITSALVFGFIASTFSSQASAAVSGDKLVKELSQGFSSLEEEFIIEEFKKYGVDINEMPDYLSAANHQTPLALGVMQNKLFDNSEVLYVTPQYVSGTGKELKNKQEKVDKEVKRIVKSLIKKNMTEKAKHDAIYSYVVKKVKYDQTTFNNYKSGKATGFTSAHTAYGALVDYLAVCQGISAAYKALADEAGLKSIVVSGTKAGVPHTWNKVMVNGKWANIDATFKNSLKFDTDAKAVSLKYKENLDYALDSEIAEGKYSTDGKPVKIETAKKPVSKAPAVKTSTEASTKTVAIYDKSVTSPNAILKYGKETYKDGFPTPYYNCANYLMIREFNQKPDLTDFKFDISGGSDIKTLGEDVLKEFIDILVTIRGNDYLDTHEIRYSQVGPSLNIEIHKK